MIAIAVFASDVRIFIHGTIEPDVVVTLVESSPTHSSTAKYIS
jgi:hypothetical protein